MLKTGSVSDLHIGVSKWHQMGQKKLSFEKLAGFPARALTTFLWIKQATFQMRPDPTTPPIYHSPSPSSYGELVNKQTKYQQLPCYQKKRAFRGEDLRDIQRKLNAKRLRMATEGSWRGNSASLCIFHRYQQVQERCSSAAQFEHILNHFDWGQEMEL